MAARSIFPAGTVRRVIPFPWGAWLETCELCTPSVGPVISMCMFCRYPRAPPFIGIQGQHPSNTKRHTADYPNSPNWDALGSLISLEHAQRWSVIRAHVRDVQRRQGSKLTEAQKSRRKNGPRGTLLLSRCPREPPVLCFSMVCDHWEGP